MVRWWSARERAQIGRKVRPVALSSDGAGRPPGCTRGHEAVEVVDRKMTVHGPDPAEHPWSIVHRADEKTDGSASTTTATSASVSLTLPDTSSTVSGPPADPASPLPPQEDF